jgi:pimeloyl-ACP methyl ester carboxylesterase
MIDSEGSVGDYARINGLELYYELHGNGQPLVLLHGGLGAIEMFGSLLPSLAAIRQVVAVDLEGHGRTGGIDRPLSFELMAEDIAALIDHLALERADILGYSLGGSIALQVALRHPNRVAKLILVSTPIKRSALRPSFRASVKLEAWSAALENSPIHQLYRRLAPKPNDWPRLLEKMLVLTTTDFDYMQQLSCLTGPTMIVAADHDIFPPAHAIEACELIGGRVQLAILPGTSHQTVFMHPAFATIVSGFLRE